jgi:hypothetical protein
LTSLTLPNFWKQAKFLDFLQMYLINSSIQNYNFSYSFYRHDAWSLT